MKISINKIVYWTIAIGTAGFGIKLYDVGLPLIACGVAIVFILFNGFAKQRLPKFKNNMILVLLYFLSLAISTVLSVNIYDSIKELAAFTIIISFLLLYDFSKIRIDSFLRVLTITMLCRTVMELSYSFLHTGEWLGKYKHFMRFSVAHYGGDPNNLAMLLIAPMIYLLFYQKNRLRYLWACLFFLHFIMLYSRGAIISLAIASFSYAIITRRFRIITYTAVALLLIGGVIFFAYINGYMTFKLDSLVARDSSSQHRFEYWSRAIDSINIRVALIGNGIRTSMLVYGNWLHNSYLNRYIETGTVGFVSYLSIMMFAFYVYLKKKSPVYIIFTVFVVGSFFVDFYQNALMWFFIGYALQNSNYLIGKNIYE